MSLSSLCFRSDARHVISCNSRAVGERVCAHSSECEVLVVALNDDGEDVTSASVPHSASERYRPRPEVLSRSTSHCLCLSRSHRLHRRANSWLSHRVNLEIEAEVDDRHPSILGEWAGGHADLADAPRRCPVPRADAHLLRPRAAGPPRAQPGELPDA